jgi:hypothetical protein
VVKEVMGAAGFKDGNRFFKFGQEVQPQAPPTDVQIAMMKAELEREKIQSHLQRVLMELRSEEKQTAEENATRLQVEAMKNRREAGKKIADIVSSREGREYSAGMQREAMAESRKGKVIDALAKLSGKAGGGGPAGPPTLTPVASQPSAVMPEQNIMMQRLFERIDGMEQRDAAIMAMLQDLQRAMRAPAEIVRDPRDGSPIGVRKAGQFQEIIRDGEGKILGSRPLERVA